jgi:hypothetical protein
MTPAELEAKVEQLERAAAPAAVRAVRWTWGHLALVLAGVVLLLSATLAWECRAAGQARAAAARAPEVAAAHAAQVPVVEQLPAADVDHHLDEALRGNAELQLSLARARKAVPGAKVGGVTRAAVEGAAHASPRPGDPAGSPAMVPILADGDGLRLEVVDVRLEGPAGGRYAAGSQRAVRLSDGAELLARPWTAPVVDAVEVAPPAPAAKRDLRLGLVGGGAAGASGATWLLGGQVLYRDHVTLAAAGGPGPDRKGAGVVLVGVLF